VNIIAFVMVVALVLPLIAPAPRRKDIRARVGPVTTAA
jgi:hypothetical protein